ncbi:ABC transporter ATP-binding protein [Pseudochryseolinea flava]|uniref:ABC transporter ATP-binding protein n=1 Tax=Pseudochryseolinea flava TaxID=2059302 RepID=A0A364XXD6_9BACT|nr:ABC transporter ATP-binding protein [Pseudochryseolinea flava]RAV98430.1 ABC transporter ATP-binding protein [Pseudochryseolinea flava]
MNKTYFRILRYAPNLRPRMVKFFIFAVLGVVFQAIYLGLTMPMMKVLFDKKDDKPVVYPTEFNLNYPGDLFKYHFKQYADQDPINALIFVCIGIVIFVFLSNIFRYLERMAASRIKVDVVKNMRMDIFSTATKLHIGFFNDQRRGDLMSRFTNDIGEVENSIVNTLKSVLKEPITIIVFLGVLFSISVKLTLFTLVLLPVIGGLIGEVIKRLKKKAKLSQEAMGRIVNILDETFSGMRVIFAFNARNFLLKKFDQETSYHRKVNLSMSRKNELASPMSEFLGVVVVAFIMYYGGTMVLSHEEGALEPEKFLLFITMYASMIQPAKNFSNGLTSLQKGTIAAERIFSVIDIKPAIDNRPDAVSLPEFKEEIEFKNVSFAYDKEPVLQNLNLKIGKGKTIALVGPSGGGKSTLADLVPRFYDPTAGQVLIDGIPLTDYNIESLRHHIGVVTQESILFNDTIFNNIAFGMENVSKDDVIAAAKIANAHDFITQTENGYDTLIGERGSKLSGGQRQRLSIARAVLKNPAILILDEATSALDSESERLVQDALNNLMKNRTSIVIAHRLSTIQHADEIIVIQSGQIVERGTHDYLIKQPGLYRKLNEIQRV